MTQKFGHQKNLHNLEIKLKVLHQALTMFCTLSQKFALSSSVPRATLHQFKNFRGKLQAHDYC